MPTVPVVLAVLLAFTACAKRAVPKEAESVTANARTYVARMNDIEEKAGSKWRAQVVHCMGDTDVPTDGYGTCTVSHARPCAPAEPDCRVEWITLQCSTTPNAGCKPRGSK